MCLRQWKTIIMVQFGTSKDYVNILTAALELFTVVWLQICCHVLLTASKGGTGSIGH